jgi:hypothetical protein
MVAGIAALALSVGSQVTAIDVERALERTAVAIPGVEFGRVNAARTIAGFAPKRAHLGASGRGARSYRLVAGSGLVDAVVTTRTSQRVTLRLLSSAGSTIATASGRGSARLRRRVEAGTYTLRVSAATSVTYVLRADYTSS